MANLEDFKVGDRVRINESYKSVGASGETGTVIAVVENGVWPIRVAADILLDGVEVGYFYPDELDILDENYPNEVPC